ncbi:MAG: small subunit ribosomal protein S17 [Gammaproteobacteria bacterium]|jgi:small subunit ribosomal protein S17
MSESKNIPRILTGKVISNKMEKSISVSIERLVKHPVYEKFIRRSTKLLAHDENNECNEGDLIIIESTKPVSKRKSWRLQKILSKAQL